MRRYDCLWINPPNWRQIYALDSHSTVPPVAIRKGSRSREYDHRVTERLVRHIARVLETKKLIGQPGKTQNIPDGYLLDFSGPKKPVSLFGASWACKARSVASHRPTIAGLFPVVSEYAAPSPQECGNIASIHRRDVTRCLHC